MLDGLEHLPKMRLQMAFLAILMFWNDPRMWILLHIMYEGTVRTCKCTSKRNCITQNS